MIETAVVVFFLIVLNIVLASLVYFEDKDK